MFAFMSSSLPQLWTGRTLQHLQSSSPCLRRCQRSPLVACARATREEVQRIAHLAQLEISDKEAEELAPEFQKVISFFDSMKELDLNGIEPMSTINNARNVVREDKPVMFADVDAIMEEAPVTEREYIRVPQISSEDTD